MYTINHLAFGTDSALVVVPDKRRCRGGTDEYTDWASAKLPPPVSGKRPTRATVDSPEFCQANQRAKMFISEQTFLAECYPYISMDFVRAMWPEILAQGCSGYDDLVAAYCGC